MSNDFFDDDDWDELARNTLARAEALNAIVAGVVTGFDRLPGQTRLYEGRVTYCGSTTGSANTQVATAPYTVTLTDGLHLRVKWGFTNTGALTLNPSSLGAVNVCDYGGNALTGGEAVAGAFGDVVYHSGSSHFRIIAPLTDVGSVSTFDINALTTGSEVDATADYVPIYDASAGGQRKVLTGLIADEYAIILKGQLYTGASL